MQNQPKRAGQISYVDRPEVSETFADSLEKLMFDGAAFRMEFVVQRIDTPQPPAPPKGQRVTATRIVLSLNGAMELAQKLNTAITVLKQQGIIQEVKGGQNPRSMN